MLLRLRHHYALSSEQFFWAVIITLAVLILRFCWPHIRSMINARKEKKQLARTLIRLSNPAYVKSLVSDTHYLLAHRPIAEGRDLGRTMEHLRTEGKLGDYTIHEVLELKQDAGLFITMNGEYHHNFVLQRNTYKSRDEVLVGWTESREERLIAEEFAQNLLWLADLPVFRSR